MLNLCKVNNKNTTSPIHVFKIYSSFGSFIVNCEHTQHIGLIVDFQTSMSLPAE